MKKEKVLVIGGTGFIGSHVANLLLLNNYSVKVVSRNTKHKNINSKDIEYITADINNKSEVNKFTSDIQYVFHIASTTNPQSSSDDLNFDIQTNLCSTINILEACVKNNILKFIYFSSGGTVYGVPEILPVKEKANCLPISSYGIVKLTVEHYINYFHHKHGLSYNILRLSNPYGPGQSPLGTQGLIGIFLYKIQKNIDINIFGDGHIIRDYIYIDDVAELCIKVLQSNQENHIINVGSGIGTTINDVVNEIINITNQSPNILYTEHRNFDVPKIYLDITKAKQIFDWEPSTTLSNGIKKTLTWLNDEYLLNHDSTL